MCSALCARRAATVRVVTKFCKNKNAQDVTGLLVPEQKKKRKRMQGTQGLRKAVRETWRGICGAIIGVWNDKHVDVLW